MDATPSWRANQITGQGESYTVDGTGNFTAAVLLQAASAERGIHTLRLDDNAGPMNWLSRLNAAARELVCKRPHAIVLVRIGATSWYVLDSEQPFALGQAPQPLKAVTDQAYHRNVTSDPVLVYGLRP